MRQVEQRCIISHVSVLQFFPLVGIICSGFASRINRPFLSLPLEISDCINMYPEPGANFCGSRNSLCLHSCNSASDTFFCFVYSGAWSMHVLLHVYLELLKRQTWGEGVPPVWNFLPGKGWGRWLCDWHKNQPINAILSPLLASDPFFKNLPWKEWLRYLKI